MNVSDKIIGLYGLGMCYPEICSQIKELYNADLSATVLHGITDKLIPNTNAGQSRPLEPLTAWYGSMRCSIRVRRKVRLRTAHYTIS